MLSFGQNLLVALQLLWGYVVSKLLHIHRTGDINKPQKRKTTKLLEFRHGRLYAWLRQCSPMMAHFSKPIMRGFSDHKGKVK